MDLEEQGAIKQVVEEHGTDDVVVILGSPDTDSAGIYGQTVTTGDPTFAGPLAGVSLGLPVFHILEDDIKTQVDPDVYQQQVGMMELVLDTASLVTVMRQIRGAG